MKKQKKRDLLLIMILLGAACILLIFSKLSGRPPAAKALVFVDGIQVHELSLRQDQELTVTGPDGGTNHLVIQNGEIWCSQASCPDQLCVRQGKKKYNTDTIVCLPNRMNITIQGGD
jgi:hypothetical protein